MKLDKIRMKSLCSSSGSELLHKLFILLLTLLRCCSEIVLTLTVHCGFIFRILPSYGTYIT